MIPNWQAPPGAINGFCQHRWFIYFVTFLALAFLVIAAIIGTNYKCWIWKNHSKQAFNQSIAGDAGFVAGSII